MNIRKLLQINTFFFLVTDWNFFFTWKKYAYWSETLNASPF